MVYDMEKGKFPVQLENIDSFVELRQVCSMCPYPLPSCLEFSPLLSSLQVPPLLPLTSLLLIPLFSPGHGLEQETDYKCCFFILPPGGLKKFTKALDAHRSHVSEK